MFGTIILDAYKEDEKKIISNSLDILCSSEDNYGWSSSGIYCYWNFYTMDILYIGLARDLKNRFDQHNGLIKIEEKSSKFNQISEYFKNNQKLGFSIFLQTTVSQINNFKNKRRHIDLEMNNEFENDLKRCEGILLQAYRLNNNDLLPKWNEIAGDITGGKRATKGNFEIIEGFRSINKFHPLTAKKTLRDISSNSVYERYESSFLHFVREFMLFYGFSYNEGVDMFSNIFEENSDLLKRMKNDKYLYDFVKL